MAKTAYVLLKLNPKDFTKGLKTAEKGTKQFDKNIALTKKRIGTLTNAAMKDLTSFGKRTAKVLGGAAAAFAGVALAKGWSRMTQIDEAKVKLEAIGNSSKNVAKIMDNAMESVKGTAYGMNDAATTAASAVAAGIKPGQDLTKYLSATADAAAVAGVDLQEMGAIFNKVATKNKATNKELTQLAKRGIPIYQYIADSIGKTTEEVTNMASKGQIDLKTFRTAVESHIGGAAKSIGSKTITGAIKNIGASISRIGANFLGSADDGNSFAARVLPALNKITENLGKVEVKAKEWGAKFGTTVGKALDYITTHIGTIKKAIKIAIPVAAGLYAAIMAYAAITKIVGVFKTLKLIIDMVKISQIGLNAAFMANPIFWIALAIGVLIAAFVALWRKSEKFRNICKKVWNVMKLVGGYIWNYLVGYFQILKTVIDAVLWPIKQVAKGLKKIFGYNGKTANVTVKETNTGGSGETKPPKKHNALGTSFFSGGTTTINEFGKEQINLPSGTEIIPADKVGKNNNTSIIVNCTVQGNVIGNQEYMEQTGNYIAARIKSALANS